MWRTQSTIYNTYITCFIFKRSNQGMQVGIGGGLGRGPASSNIDTSSHGLLKKRFEVHMAINIIDFVSQVWFIL